MVSPAGHLPSPPPSARGTLLGLVLGLAALGVVLALTQSVVFDLDRHLVPKELVLHACAFLGLIILLPRWRTVAPGLVDAILAAWVGWSALTALLAQNHWLAFRGWGISFAGLVVFLMAREAARNGRGRLVVRLLALAGVVAALTGLAQAYGLDWDLLSGERAPGGTLGNRNFLAHLTAITLPLVGLATIEAVRRPARVTAFIGMVLMAAAIVLTRSRAAWLATGMSLVVMILAALVARRRQGPLPRRRLVALPAALALGAALAMAVPNRLQWRSDAPYAESLRGIVNYQEGSGRGRLIQYQNTLRLVARDPVFGTGPGNWMVHYPRVTAPGDPSFSGADPIPTNPWPSSDWMAFWAERGLIGVLLLLGAGLAAGLTLWRRLGDPELAAGSVALLGVLVAAVVAGLFDAVLLLAAPTFFTFAAAGALLPPTGAVTSRALAGRARVTAVAGSLLIGLLLVLQSAGGTAAIALTGESRQRSALEAAARFDPGNHRLHLLLAMRGSCAQRRPHAAAAVRLLPWHEWPRRALEACGR